MVGAGSFTAAVFLIWIFTGPGQLPKEEETQKPRAAFSTFLGQVKEQMAGASDALPDTDATTAVEENSPDAPVMLNASSTKWSLSSSTVADKRIEREVPIIVVPASPTSSVSSTPPVR